MTDLDRRIEALLEGAWQGASPTAGDLDRVEALVRARVGTPNGSGGAGAAGSSGAGSGGDSAGLAAPGRPPGDRAIGAPERRIWPRLLPQATTAAERARLLGWGSLIAGVAFLIGVGYGRGQDISAATPPATTPPAPPVNPAAVTGPSAASPESVAPPPSASPIPSSGAAQHAQRPSPPLAPQTQPHPSPAPVPARSVASRTAAGGSHEGGGARAVRRGLGFDAVLALLERAERAERRSEPALAIALLDQIDEQADAETLRDERLITRVLAACALGHVDAARSARARLESATGTPSIYASRLSETCVATPAHPLGASAPVPDHGRSDSR